MTKEELKETLLKDFKELLVKEFTADFEAKRLLVEMYLSVMSLNNTMKLIEQRERQLTKVIDKAQEFIRNETSLNESEIDELSEILDSYRN